MTTCFAVTWTSRGSQDRRETTLPSWSFTVKGEKETVSERRKAMVSEISIMSDIKRVVQIYLEKAMAPHSSALAWKIPWMEEPGRLQSMGSLRSDTTERLHFHFSLSCIGEGNGNPLQCSCLENPRDGGAWWAAVYGVTQSWTWLKRLSRSSSRDLLLGEGGISWSHLGYNRPLWGCNVWKRNLSAKTE